MAVMTFLKNRCWHRTFFVLITALWTLAAPPSLRAEELELEMINRPVNLSGLTGLLFTTSPFTVPSGFAELSAAALSEKSTKPDYTLNEIPFSITAGISNSMELTLKGAYLQRTTSDGIKKRGTGNTELTYKWNFLPQAASSSMPAIAVIVGGIAATSSIATQIDSIERWGARIGLSAGREAEWGDHIIGVYADASMIIHDLSDGAQRDRYGVFNAGLLFPISKYRNLQMMIEYSLVSGVDRITTVGGDQSSITYGLRLVNEKFNFTIGTEFIHKHEKDFDRSSRIIGMTSIKF